MEFKTLLEKRRSVRKFAPTAVPSEVVDRLLAETLGAPSSRNSRSTRLLVVDDPEVVARMASMRDYGSAFMKGAPLAIVVLGDTACSDLWRINAAISATVLHLACVDEGSPRAGSTSTDVPASRRSLRGSRRPTICGRSSPFPRGANRSARWPSAIRTSCRRRCPRPTTAAASSASEPERPGWPGRPGDAALRSCRKTGTALYCPAVRFGRLTGYSPAGTHGRHLLSKTGADLNMRSALVLSAFVGNSGGTSPGRLPCPLRRHLCGPLPGGGLPCRSSRSPQPIG